MERVHNRRLSKRTEAVQEARDRLSDAQHQLQLDPHDEKARIHLREAEEHLKHQQKLHREALEDHEAHHGTRSGS